MIYNEYNISNNLFISFFLDRHLIRNYKKKLNRIFLNFIVKFLFHFNTAEIAQLGER